MILSIKRDSSHGRIRMPLVNIIGQLRCYFLLLFVPVVSLILLGSPVHASTDNSNPSVQFSDNGTLTLSAEAVTLETLLEKIQEKSSMEFEIPENLLRQPISVSFRSLPLEKAIRRVLRGVSYSCIFDSKGSIEKIIALPNASKDKDNHIARRAPRLDFPPELAMETMPPPELENLMVAMEDIPSPEVEDIEEAVEITPPPEVVKGLVEAIKAEGGTPPPELEELMEAMESMPSHGEENKDEPVETMSPPEVEDQIAGIRSAGGAPPFELEELMEAMETMPPPQVENTDEAVEITPPPEAVKDLLETIKDAGGTPPHELEELVKAMEGMSPPEMED